uniref:Interleukin-1 n=2 Tax=Siniperca chuatsi TaxID=119488 RepID=Q5QEJ2_SINCH|nr:interleukin-1 beta [Siniperca chuatsi]
MESEMKCNMSEMWSLKMPKGLDLEITHHPLTMRSVVNLVIAMERLKGSGSVRSTKCTDENLLNFMMESIVEEQTVFERGSAPPLQFRRTDEYQCSVTDSKKRSLVLVQNSMELHAMMLQGGAENSKVYLNMSTYIHPAPSAEARTVALGIRGTNLYLSCHKDGPEATLHLEAVEDKNSLLSIRSDSDMVRFLFYKQDTGVNISTLVSVAFRDWYISTAVDNNKPVEMCLETAQRHRTFNIQHQSSNLPRAS